MVQISDLTKGSKVKVLCRCECCDKERIFGDYKMTLSEFVEQKDLVE